MSSSEREWSPAPGLVALRLGRARPPPRGLVRGDGRRRDPIRPDCCWPGWPRSGCCWRAVFGSRARPRLRVDAGGVTVGGLFRARHYPWPLVEDVRVLQVRRLGRRTSLLELDTVTASGDERLLVFGRLDLAADPEDVAPQVLALRPTTRPR